MPQRKCEHCGELADDSKAFCPECGNPFVAEEKREASTNFEKMDSTVQLGQTMYNQMLSDMGLKGDKPAPAEPKREPTVLQPIAPVQAAVKTPTPVAPSKPPVETDNSATITKLIVITAAVFVFLLIAAIAIVLIWMRFLR
jgi:hypothetical protein